jgi:DNA-3-methyladenine glycosylase II
MHLATEADRGLHVARTRLAAPRGFELEHSLSFLCSFPPTRGEQRTSEGVLTKAWSIEGRAALVALRADTDGLSACITTERPLSESAAAALFARVRFQLSLDDDLAALEARAATDTPFAPVARRWRGHHHVKFPTPFEIAVWAVLAQRNQRAGRCMKDALVAAFGPGLVVAGLEHRAFPEPATVLAAGEARLRALGIDEARSRAIATIARAFAQPSYERCLLEAPIDVAEAELRALPRIGPWSAAFVLFRGLGRMERLPAASGPILEAAGRVYGPKTERELRAIAASYGRSCGYWSLYLRRS